MRLGALLTAIALFAATPAAAQLRAVPVQPASEQEALRGVEVVLLNEGSVPLDAEGPREIEVTAADGTRLVLQRLPAPKAVVAPGAFAKARYVPVGVAGVMVPPAAAHPAATADADEANGARETVVRSSTGSSAGLLERFEPHEPVYGVFGAGAAGGKLQVSFAFRPFAEKAPLKLGNLRFAYTQTMFWALDKPSGPFRATTYSPEVYADVPVDPSATFALGYRHDSNGGGVTDSVDADRIFVRAEKSFDLGRDWRLDVAPEAWLFVGDPSNRGTLADHWGHTALTLSVGKKDGIKISLTGRGNFATRRGAAELFVSYPMAKLGGLGLYLFGQAFSGDGEALSDYARHETHARIGIALTR